MEEDDSQETELGGLEDTGVPSCQSLTTAGGQREEVVQERQLGED